jgi:hypothetical protein
MTVEEICAEVRTLTPEKRKQLLATLLEEFPIHPLEKKLGVTAETILEAISRASDLTVRGIRGVIAESVFSTQVLPKILEGSGWSDVTPRPDTDRPFDSLLRNSAGKTIRIQVKNQRLEKGVPKIRKGCAVVETQKTRSGKKRGVDTRPYRVDEFDILAVCLKASCGRWTDFVYALTRDLDRRPAKPALLTVFQHIPMAKIEAKKSAANRKNIWSQNLIEKLNQCAKKRP